MLGTLGAVLGLSFLALIGCVIVAIVFSFTKELIGDLLTLITPFILFFVALYGLVRFIKWAWMQ